MVEDIRRRGALSVMDSRPYQYRNAHIKQVLRRTLESRRKDMMETVSMLQKSNVKVLDYGEQKDYGKLGCTDERMKRD